MLVVSIYFYASWSVKYLALIGVQLGVDWTCGYLLGRTETSKKRKLILTTSILVNLGSLCIFKYYNFIAETLLPIGMALPALNLTLPLAISFYTFESMSYTIDVYRNELKPVKSPIHLALFITWFPHLIAGPIIRPSIMIPQMDRITFLTSERFFSGLGLMLSGYARKLLFADWFATVANPIFADPTAHSSLEILVGIYAYAMQIYFDFSAYTDIARGASRWFGIELPENFNFPYQSLSITEFWRRWHMTLSQWLRDYLYISLGGNRLGNFRTYINLIITMLLGGLWHGASWMFVIWGGIHGIALALERVLKIDSKKNSLHIFERALRWFVTFHIVCIAWVFFRSQSMSTALYILNKIAHPTAVLSKEMTLGFFGTIGLIIACIFALPYLEKLKKLNPLPFFSQQILICIGVGIFLTTLIVFGATSNDFIYFQF